TRVSSSLPIFGRDFPFSREAFQQDLYRVVAYLSDHGFPQARVTHVEIRPEPPDGVRLTVHVEPGRPVIVDRVQLYGFDMLDARDYAAVQRRVRLTEGERRLQDDVRRTRAATVAVLQERGFAHASVDVLEGD